MYIYIYICVYLLQVTTEPKLGSWAVRRTRTRRASMGDLPLSPLSHLPLQALLLQPLPLPPLRSFERLSR